MSSLKDTYQFYLMNQLHLMDRTDYEGTREWDQALTIFDDQNGEVLPMDRDVNTDWFIMIGRNFPNKEPWSMEESGWLSRNTPQSADDIDWNTEEPADDETEWF